MAGLDDSPTLRPRYRAARSTLRADFESERAELPAVDGDRPWTVEGVDVSETPAGEALDDLYQPIDPEYEDGWADGTLARSVLWGHRSFVSLRAFASLRARVAEGERFEIESVEDVAALRSEAVDAVRSANADPAVPTLTRAVLADVVRGLANADADLASSDDEVRVVSLRYPAANYLVVAARANATPSASDHVASALRE